MTRSNMKIVRDEPPRTPVQITCYNTDGHVMILALCNDGTIWIKSDYRLNDWETLPPIPQTDTPSTLCDHQYYNT